MKNPILLTKLFIPSLAGGIINRPQLTNLLNDGFQAGRPLTLVSAPAGYGKSTLIAEWATLYKGDIAWLSLDERDNDPQRFWGYFLEALRTISAISEQLTIYRLDGMQPYDPQRFITDLLNEIAALGRRVILVLDDFHIITSREIHEELSFLLEHLPPSLHIVIVSRTDPPLPLSRLRVRRRVTEVRIAELRFTADEVSVFLNGLMSLRLDPSDVQALGTRTEGWIAGLHLAALSMKDRADTHEFIRDFTGSQRFILEYLADEVLRRLPESLQIFLLRTSILSRMCAPLCEAVTGCSGAIETLADLERRNLFIIPMDDEHYWLRYHHLFTEFLKGRLKLLRAEDLPVLHRRAAEWFQLNNLPEDALQHAFAIPDYTYVNHLVTDNWRRIYHKGQLDTAVKWLESLPGDLLTKSPPLGIAFCWTLFIRGDYERIYSYLESIENTFTQSNKTGEFSAQHPEYSIILHQAVLLRSIVTRHRGDPATAIKDIEKLLPAIGELRKTLGQQYFDMGMAACYSQLGYSYLAAKDYDSAEFYLARVGPHTRACGNFFTLAHTTIERIKIILMRGRIEEAEEICRRELYLAEQQGIADYPAFCLIHLALAEVLCAKRSFEEADTFLVQGLETATKTGHQFYLARGYMIAAHLHKAMGNQSQAMEDLRKAEVISSALKNSLLDMEVLQTRETLEGRTLKSQPLIEALSERELEVLRLINAGKSNQEIADNLYIALDTVKRHTNNIYGKLGVNRRTQAIMEAHRLELI